MIEFIKSTCPSCRCSFEAVKFESSGHVMALCDPCIELEAIRIANKREQYENQMKQAKDWIQSKLAKHWLLKKRAHQILSNADRGYLRQAVVCKDEADAKLMYKALCQYARVAAGTNNADLNRPDMPCVFSAEALHVKKDRVKEILEHGIPCITISVGQQIKGWITQAIDFTQV